MGSGDDTFAGGGWILTAAIDTWAPANDTLNAGSVINGFLDIGEGTNSLISEKVYNSTIIGKGDNPLSFSRLGIDKAI